jgi:leucine dehydrogenase
MTLKSATADLDLGGGKAVLLDDGLWGERRDERLQAFGRFVDRLDGRFVTAEDVGTTPADMAVIASVTPWVAGRPIETGGVGDPSPATARTVFGSLEAAAQVDLETSSLRGLTVGVLGVGAVGAWLVRLLKQAGADTVVSDLDERRAAEVANAFGAGVVCPDELFGLELDMLAPCALGEVIGSREVGRLRCRAIAGAANNPLAGDNVAEELHRAGILYVPDFVANCGGIIHVGAEVLRLAPVEVEARIGAAVDRARDLLRTARGQGVPPLRLATERALARISAAQLNLAA